MLNQDGQRELAYVVNIDQIEPIVGSDNCEAAVVGGWRIMVRKGTFQPGDKAIYFEIDSKVPETDTYEFLAKKNYRVKTQKYTFGGKNPGFYSQGLLMSFDDFVDKDGRIPAWLAAINSRINVGEDVTHTFLTKELGVIYADPNDNKRKANSKSRYASMQQRYSKLFKRWPFKVLMRYELGRKFLFVFFGKKKDKKDWPSWIAAKTDVERIQNMIYVLQDKKPFVATEKVDGSSCSIMAEKNRFGKIKYYVCSRNVVFDGEDQKCFYDTNVYFEVYHKYDFKNKITQILNDLNLKNVAIQMEVYGSGIQKRTYSTNEHKAAVFHIVSNGVKFPMDKTIEICEKYDLPHVPIIDENYILPDTLDELKEYVEGQASLIDGLPKEGIVFYDKETGQQYFKFVSPDFLVKYHG